MEDHVVPGGHFKGGRHDLSLRPTRHHRARQIGGSRDLQHSEDRKDAVVSQSRLGSFIEAVVNIAIGFLISLAVGHFAFPWFGWEITPLTNIKITLVFTITSIARQYLLRRYFNARLRKFTESL